MSTTNAQFVHQMYITYLQRPAEPAGHAFWVGELEAGVVTREELAAQFGGSEEFAGRFTEANRAELINEVYQALFGRDAEEEGLAFWMSEETDIALLPTVIAAASADWDGATLQNRLTFAEKLMENLTQEQYESVTQEQLREMLSNVTEDTEVTDEFVKDVVAGVELGDDTDTSELTEALTALSNAQDAQVNFLKGLELDVNDDGKYDSVDHAAGKATEANVNAVFGNAANAISGETATSLSAADYQDLTKQSLQNTDIETALTKAKADVTVATAAAKTGMTALIESADQALKDYNDAVQAKGKADADLTVEEAAFNAVAGAQNTANVVYAADYDPTIDNSSNIIISNGKAYTGQVGTVGTPVALSALVEDTTVQRVAELEAAKAAVVAAQTTIKSQHEALVDAVGAIYVLEAGGHSLADIGTAVPALASPAVTITVYDLTAVDVEVYKTAADEAVYGVQQVLTVGAVSGADGTFDFTDTDLTKVTVTDGMTAVQAAAAVVEAFDTSKEWIVTASGDKVTFKAAAETAAELSVTVTTATSADTKIAANTAAPSKLAAGAPNADNLSDKLESLSDLEKAIANFQAARDIKVKLEALKEDVAEAQAHLTDSIEDGGLGIKLREGAQDFTTGDDVYLFNAETSKDQSLANFGARGEDKIFFGEDFKLVALGDQDIAKNVGDVAQLEIFWAQGTTGVDLYVETETFAGNATGVTDLVKVTLTGVQGADLALEDGFLAIS